MLILHSTQLINTVTYQSGLFAECQAEQDHLAVCKSVAPCPVVADPNVECLLVNSSHPPIRQQRQGCADALETSFGARLLVQQSAFAPKEVGQECCRQSFAMSESTDLVNVL